MNYKSHFVSNINLRFQYIICIGWTLWKGKADNRRDISIHHMYRLNGEAITTSLIQHLNFNTSYVSVEPQVGQPTDPLKALFQYIICISWTFIYIYLYAVSWHISIHHMYRLNKWYFIVIYIIYLISIHHMYRLNVSLRISIMAWILISIHHMYRLNLPLAFLSALVDTYFNTSYVSVERYIP